VMAATAATVVMAATVVTAAMAATACEIRFLQGSAPPACGQPQTMRRGRGGGSSRQLFAAS
jgi:hypothetical protein